MLRFTHKAKNVLHYEIKGSLSEQDLREYYRVVDGQFRQFGKLDLHLSATRFQGYAGARALLTFLRNEPALLKQVASYNIVSDQAWLRGAIRVLGWCVPHINVTVRARTQVQR